MQAGHFERTYDGVTWETISETEVRRKLEGYYSDIDLALETLKEGHELRTSFAWYRYMTQEAQP